jgi:integrase
VRLSKKRINGAGTVRQLPSGRWQARYRDDTGKQVAAPVTFDTKLDASTWLAGHDDGHRDLVRGPAPTLKPYAEAWLAARDLKPRTRADYGKLLEARILPEFGSVRLDRITPAAVRTWHAGMRETPTLAARAYGLLRTILGTAVDDELLDRNPCRIRGGGNASRATSTLVLEVSEVEALTEAMPPRYRAMVALAAWCGLRFGELTELRRSDLDPDASRVHVRRAVTRVDGEFVVGEPKSAAGVRTVAVPAHIRPLVLDHLRRHTGRAPGALLFPAAHGGHMAPSALYKPFYRARTVIGREDLRFHDLRHTGAVLATLAGASLVEVQSRLGHSTVGAAMRYQHVVNGRDEAIADALAAMATGTVTPLRRGPRTA